MLCHQARKKLNEYEWCYSKYSLDEGLIIHLRECRECASLVQAEEALRKDFDVLRQAEPQGELSLNAIREKAEISEQSQRSRGSFAETVRAFLGPHRKRKLAFGAIALLLAFAALFPFSFREKVGYQIAIEGVEKDIALDNQKIPSLLGALGMEKDKASNLLDSLGTSQMSLSVGECTETCRLTISDLKTERDVRLMVKAIVELGCCRIDDIIPVFRNESTSLLGLAARKLLS